MEVIRYVSRAYRQLPTKCNFAGTGEEAVKEIMTIIRTSEKTETIESNFQYLDKLQFILAKILYKENYDISQYLKVFVADFDRLDDAESRWYLVKKIKNGEYV